MIDNTALARLDTVNARLPQTYEAARQALAECTRIDECRDWANKAEAMASYARQADDDTLYKFARRIQGRAVRRVGELLKHFQSPGGRPSKTPVGTHPSFPPSQRQAAADAGMSEHQEKTAVRVANIPAAEFDAAMESDNPPSVTALADLRSTARPGFKKATHLLGTVDRFATFCNENDPLEVAQGVLPAEASDLRGQVTIIDGWLDRFVVSLEA